MSPTVEKRPLVSFLIFCLFIPRARPQLGKGGIVVVAKTRGETTYFSTRGEGKKWALETGACGGYLIIDYWGMDPFSF